jgi:NAD(P)-dependent dehydrogenase (short-subunit alcohol dehydrogenase family)
MQRLAGKVALITGGARGLGLSMARRFRAEGATVIINDVNASEAHKVAVEIDGSGLGADVSNSTAVARMFEYVAAEYQRLDVLVNNAGINGLDHRPQRAEEFRRTLLTQAAELGAGRRIRTHLDFTVTETDEEWRRMLAVHLDGTFFCTRAALKIMNPQMSGSIINIGSIAGTAGVAGSAAYAAAKGGILGFTRAVAREVISRGIRVNAIAPGWIETDMTSFFGEVRPLIAAQTPMGRLGEPDDIAWAAVYLASEEAKFVTGQVLSPNGGWYMSQ